MRQQHQKYIYAPFTAGQFNLGLATVGITTDIFAMMFALPNDRVARWAAGTEEIRRWVPIVLVLLTAPGSVKVALSVPNEPFGGDSFTMALHKISTTKAQFAVIFGMRPDRVDEWATTKLDIPRWVPIALTLLRLPGALDLAIATANYRMIGTRREMKEAANA